MNSILAITVVWGAVTSALIPVLMKLPSLRKMYEQMDDHKLAETSAQAKALNRSFKIIAHVGPLPIVLLLAILKTGELVTTLLVVTLMVVFSGFTGADMCREIEHLTLSEIEFRKFKKDNTSPSIGGPQI